MKRIIFLLTAIFMCIGAHGKTETINWYMDGNTYATTQCETGSDIILPQTPYKYGYTFNGWFGYTPIEYLKSTGTQYIDTGILPNSTTTFDISVMFNTIIADSSIPLGSRSTGLSSTSPDQFYVSASTGSGIIYRSGTNITTLIQNPSINTKYNLSVSNSYATADGTYPLTLFGFNNIGTISNKLAQKIYSCKICDNGTLVRDFIPVLDSNNVPCMFDKVEKKFYYNAGTGDFIAGPVIGE